MATYGEYTTVQDTRSIYKGQTGVGSDALWLSLIREASRLIDSSGKVTFYPRVETRKFNIPRGVSQWPLIPTRYDLLTDNSKLGGVYTSNLVFDRPLLELTTLTNGDGSVLAASMYWLYDANFYPKRALKLKPTSGKTWLLDSSGNWEQVISVAGVWGYHEDYTNAWGAAGTITDGAGINASVTTYTASDGHGIKAGHLLKIESEYCYASTVLANTITLVRGVNGSTAATHATGTAVSVWQVDDSIADLCRVAAVAKFALRENPIGETIQFEGGSFSTPKDIGAYIDKRIDSIGIGWEVTG